MPPHKVYDSDNLRRTSAGNLRRAYNEKVSSDGSIDSADPLLGEHASNSGSSRANSHLRQSITGAAPKALLLIATVFVISGLLIAVLPPYLPSNFWPARSGRLVVDEVPTHVRPYVVRAYTIPGVQLGDQIYRFPVTGASSDNAFTLLSTAAPASDKLGVLPHVHHLHYENFYCLRGRFMLWAHQGDEQEGEQQARLMTPGDYGAVPMNTTHTFQIIDPFTEMIGVVTPGGFEELFYFLAQSKPEFRSDTLAPFPIGEFELPGGNPAVMSKLKDLDVHARFAFQPRRDVVDGAAPLQSKWRTGSASLAEDSETPFFIARERGPKYLSSASGHYQLVQPFIRPQQSGGNFTQGTITLSRLPASAKAAMHQLPGHTALEVVDGIVMVRMQGETIQLAIGDVAFVPAGTEWSFWSEVAFTKVLYVGQGSDTLDQRMMRSAESWTSALFPHEAPAVASERKRSRIERR